MVLASKPTRPAKPNYGKRASRLVCVAKKVRANPKEKSSGQCLNKVTIH